MRGFVSPRCASTLDVYPVDPRSVIHMPTRSEKSYTEFFPTVTFRPHPMQRLDRRLRGASDWTPDIPAFLSMLGKVGFLVCLPRLRVVICLVLVAENGGSERTSEVPL